MQRRWNLKEFYQGMHYHISNALSRCYDPTYRLQITQNLKKVLQRKAKREGIRLCLFYQTEKKKKKKKSRVLIPIILKIICSKPSCLIIIITVWGRIEIFRKCSHFPWRISQLSRRYDTLDSFYLNKTSFGILQVL